MSVRSDSRSRASDTRAMASSRTWTVRRSLPASPVRNCAVDGPGGVPPAGAAVEPVSLSAGASAAGSAPAGAAFFRRKNMGRSLPARASNRECGARRIAARGRTGAGRRPGKTLPDSRARAEDARSHPPIPRTPPTMQVTLEPRDNFTILHLRGEFDTFYCALLQKEVEGLIASGVNRIALNLRLVKFINSTALGAIIKASKVLNAHNGKLVVSRPSVFCKDIMER